MLWNKSEYGQQVWSRPIQNWVTVIIFSCAEHHAAADLNEWPEDYINPIFSLCDGHIIVLYMFFQKWQLLVIVAKIQTKYKHVII